MDLKSAGYEVSVYNYGQPRIGNKAYAEFCDKFIDEQYRHVHYKDIVPHSPAEDMSFRHSTTEVYEDSDGSVRLCSSTNGEDSSCSN